MVRGRESAVSVPCVRYACPECGGATEKAGGPDHILKVRCQDCDWWDTFDPAADEFAPNELERIDHSEDMDANRHGADR